MGCDIHVHVEVRIGGQWHHYNSPTIVRDYELFAKMAGVCGIQVPIAPVRGLPSDITLITKLDFERMTPHTASWLTAIEAAQVQQWYNRNYPPLFDYVFGNDMDTYTLFPNQTKQLGLEEIRVVFWFDS